VFQRRGGDNFGRSRAVVSCPGLWDGAVDLSENVRLPLAGMSEVSVLNKSLHLAHLQQYLLCTIYLYSAMKYIGSVDGGRGVHFTLVK